MKFSSWPAFCKHLADSAPDHLAPVYLVIAACRYERRKIFEKIFSTFKANQSDLDFTWYNAGEIPLSDAIVQLSSPSLFGPVPVIVFDGLDQLKKSDWDPLFAYVEKPPSLAHLLLGSAQTKNTAELYQKGKKELIVLDLSEEKVWDRKARVQRHLLELAQQHGKKLSLEGALYMIEQVGLDLSRLEQELIKLVCFIGERSAIEMQDIEMICSAEKHSSTWQLSEAIIWEKKSPSPPSAIDLAWLLPFLGQLRYQLQIGLQLAVMLDMHMLPGDMAKQFPQLRGALLDKRIGGAKQLGQQYFRSGLLSLFDIEMLAKQSGGTAPFLFDLLTAKLASGR